eukprot:g18773.t1
MARPPSRQLLSFLVTALALGGPGSQSAAQEEDFCGAMSITPLRVESADDALALDAAVNCADGGPVEAIWSGAVTIDTPISIGSGTSLSITAQDPALAEVRGGPQTRLFDVSSSGGLTLANLTLSGGSGDSGGAIRAISATVTLDSCVFEGNVATAGDGGAVWADGGELTMLGGGFSGNNASGSGGAMRAVDVALVVRGGTVFEENRATREGGALYCGGGENSTRAAGASCSLGEVVFTANQVGQENGVSIDVTSWTQLYGGGAAAFYRVAATITDSVFELNYAELSGGGLYGGAGSDMTVERCTFEENSTPGYGGGLAASSASLGGGTVVTNNSATDGGGVFGWDVQGLITFDEMTCEENTASGEGGCFYAAGGGLTTNSTTMRDNDGLTGGCIHADGFSEVSITGGEFTGCTSSGNGGFIYVSDGATATISGGTVSNCVAGRRAGVMYCSGDSFGFGGANCTITGGSFTDNRALEIGGAVVAWGTTSGGLTPTVVTITGGLFSNNTAKFYGGFIFLEELASLSCDGAIVQDNTAGDQGGAIYARDAIWVNSSCDLTGNAAPMGAAAYLTHVESATFEDHDITGTLASGVSGLYAAHTPVVARGVNFQMEADVPQGTPSCAVMLEGEASLVAEDCVFGGWNGEAVICNASPAAGSLVLESCDFRESSATMMVLSPNSDAEIRNAFVGDSTVENAATVNGSLVLVDRALSCEDPDACGAGGECVDSDLGVLCECLEDGVCLDGGGALSIGVKTEPPNVTYSPDPVYFELTMSAGADGTTPTIWNLSYEAEDLALQVVPSSGVLLPGDEVTVGVTGTPLQQDVGGEIVSRFVAASVGNATTADDELTVGVGEEAEVEVESSFFLCPAFQFAMPVGEDTEIECEQCDTTIEGSDGVDCSQPGATLASLPLREGYWRSSQASRVVHQCIHPDACVGGTQVSSSEDYCEDGYEGPYCAVCQEGYGKGAGSTCHACDSTKSRLLIAAGSLFILFELALLVLGVVFLVGGLDAVEGVRRQLTTSFTAKRFSPPVHEAAPSPLSENKTLGEPSGGSLPDLAPAFAAASTTAAGEALEDEQGNGVTGVALEQAPNRPADEVGENREVSASTIISSGLGGRSGCCGVGDKIKRWASKLPMDKLKIVVVVWQILTVFPSITGVDFPASYSRFLSWIDVVNFDLASLFVGSCILPALDFYQRLLLTTLAPIALAALLACTYWTAIRRAGASGILRKAAWSRHMAAGLLITFLVFTSTSTIAFKTFACDEEAVEGESFLRADYSLSCNTTKHTWYEVYAGFMILVYPIGIPLLYAYILWVNRELLNPRIQQVGRAEPDEEMAKSPPTCSSEERQLSMQETLERRLQNPDLVPSMFLWKDFGPNMYYYEVIECGRRILLTGVLVFIAPNTSAQAAAACIFAFLSLVGFELLRPHLDPADSWLYRLGCMIIFLTNFLALLIKVDSSSEGSRDVFAGILVAINVMLILAVLATSWFATQQSVDDHMEGETAFNVAVDMLTFEQLAAKSAGRSRTALQPPTASSQINHSPIEWEGGPAEPDTQSGHDEDGDDDDDDDHDESDPADDPESEQEDSSDMDLDVDMGLERAESLSSVLQQALAATANAAAVGKGRGLSSRQLR